MGLVSRSHCFQQVCSQRYFPATSFPKTLKSPGMLVPQREHSNLSTYNGRINGNPNHRNVKINRIIETERFLFENIPTATHFRYPWVYGEDSMSVWEYLIVKRVLDGRKCIILPDGGLTLQTRRYSENIVHAMMLALGMYQHFFHVSHSTFWPCIFCLKMPVPWYLSS